MGNINIPNQNIGQKVPEQGGTTISNLKNLKSGAGQPIKSTTDGFFIGGESFATAPWAVDYAGNQYIGANGEIQFLGPQKKITVGTNNEIVIDGNTDKITVGTSSQVVLDGAAGTITTNYIKDSTYGFNGVFCKTISTSDWSGNVSYQICPASGGLLSASGNYISSGDNYWWMNPVGHFYVYKSGGYYYVYHAGATIHTDYPNATKIYYTLLFNSQETNGW